MFGSSKKMNTAQSYASNSLAHNSLVKGTSIEGKVKSDTDIRIDGELLGDLSCGAKVVLGKDGIVHGNIVCRKAVILGLVKGNIQVLERLDLASTANIEGHIITAKLVIEDGAVFNGTCKMGKQTLNDNGGEGGKKDARKSRKEQKAS